MERQAFGATKNHTLHAMRCTLSNVLTQTKCARGHPAKTRI
jgi:hypothetical protein